MIEFYKHGRYVMGENPLTALAFCLFLLFVMLAMVGPAVSPYNPLTSDTANALQAPSWAHWFGTDHLGRDMLSRVIVATRLDLGIAVTAVGLSFIIGSALGSLAGFYGGWMDRIVGRVMDTIMAFPLFVLAMGIVAAMGTRLKTLSMRRRLSICRFTPGSHGLRSMFGAVPVLSKPHVYAATLISVYWRVMCSPISCPR